ncbi:1081_t:CDS:2, partial [Gigaspora rosea]
MCLLITILEIKLFLFLRPFNIPTILTSLAPILKWLFTSPAPFYHFNKLPISSENSSQLGG